MSLIYLYSYKLPVQLSMTDHRAPNYNRPMYNYNVTVYKNNYNIIDLVIRNNDRKPVSLIGCVLQVIIQHTQSNIIILEKNADITDDINGRAQIVLSADDTRNWSLGGYQYNVKITRPNKGQEFLYVDINNNATGTFDLVDSVGSSFIAAKTITFDKLTNITRDWDNISPYLVSGAISATNDIGNTAGLFSVAVYQNLWRGTFKVQASLSNLSPTDKSWFDVELFPGITQQYFDGTMSSPTCFNFSMNVRWIKFIVFPDSINVTGPDITNNTINNSTNFINGVNTSLPSNEFTKIVYKIS